MRTEEPGGNLSAVHIAPNPAVDQLFVRFDLKEMESLRYAVHDLTGRLMTEGEFGNLNAGKNTRTLELGNLPSGMYQLEVISGSGSRTEKFVVERR
ncbi:MAG: T9SS type A sorting domain-containing protein [Lewinellaceae bacterium]|nr:T9SS type A sorting domain-containing protein [Lewinellaceae bacterium]